MKLRTRSQAFTLTELIVAAGVFGILSIAIITFLSTSTRLVGRNITTNHSHDSVRASTQRMLAELHSAGSAFTLIDFTGSAYNEISAPSATTDRDQLSRLFLSQRTNAVRFRRLAGGPFKVSNDTTASRDTVQFEFGVGGKLPYLPQANDKVFFPLIDREFLIVQVVTPPTTGSTRGTVRLDDVLGYKLTTGGSNVTTGMFFRRAAFSVWDERLRYHANFEGAAANTVALVRDNVTSPKPFALLFPSSTSLASDKLQLRVSLECSDTKSSARRYLSGTTTLLSVIPPRNLPTFLSSSE